MDCHCLLPFRALGSLIWKGDPSSSCPLFKDSTMNVDIVSHLPADLNGEGDKTSILGLARREWGWGSPDLE